MLQVQECSENWGVLGPCCAQSVHSTGSFAHSRPEGVPFPTSQTGRWRLGLAKVQLLGQDRRAGGSLLGLHWTAGRGEFQAPDLLQHSLPPPLALTWPPSGPTWEPAPRTLGAWAVVGGEEGLAGPGCPSAA